MSQTVHTKKRSRIKGTPRVLLVEDEMGDRERLAWKLGGLTGRVEVKSVKSIAEAVKVFGDTAKPIHAAVIDIGLETTAFDEAAISQDLRRPDDPWGLTLAQFLRKEAPGLPIFGISSDPTNWRGHCHEWFESIGYPERTIGIYEKARQLSLLRFHLYESVGLEDKVSVIFVYADGNNRVGDFTELAKKFGFSVILLGDQERLNEGWMKLFEKHADQASLAWVLCTPDEWASRIGTSKDAPVNRTRPNVTLELGYLFGRFGRDSKRVFVFQCDSVVLPSDIVGLANIHVDGPLSDAKTIETIQGQLKPWLPLQNT
jgi:hypothetical protein